MGDAGISGTTRGPGCGGRRCTPGRVRNARRESDNTVSVMSKLLTLGFPILLTLVSGVSPPAQAQPLFAETDVFVGGQDDVNTYRIPSLICTKSGTVLVFCEGRRDSNRDGSSTHLVLKRSLGNAGTIGIIYETGNTYDGVVEYYARLAFARFNLEGLTDGKDRLEKQGAFEHRKTNRIQSHARDRFSPNDARRSRDRTTADGTAFLP